MRARSSRGQRGAVLPEGMLEVQVALPLRAVGASLVAIAAPNPSPQLRRAVGLINAREQPELAINRLQDLGVTLATATTRCCNEASARGTARARPPSQLPNVPSGAFHLERGEVAVLLAEGDANMMYRQA